VTHEPVRRVPVVMVPGAFRGAWMWDEVALRLSANGFDPRPVDLSGSPDGPAPSMQDWVADVAARCETEPRSTVVVGHSMGGVVAQAATGRCRAIAHVILLDAPLIGTGERAVDVSGAAGTDLPPAETWIAPRPVGPEQGFDAESAARVNDRLVATPFRPSLDPVTVDGSVPRSVVFFDRTPGFFPSALSRARCDADGTTYRTVDTHHDGPILEPTVIADLIADLIDESDATPGR